ncbi:MAG: alginate lyase family protein, partial [Armatimonadota bacterium]
MEHKQTRGMFAVLHLRCIFWLFIILLSANCALAFSVSVGKQHPFLFVDKSEVESAKSNVFARKLPRVVTAYNKLKSKADSALSLSVPSSYGYEENSAEKYGAAGVRLATAYVMTGDTRYAAKARSILIGLAKGFNPSSSTVSYNYYLGFSRNIPMYAHIYDLLYNYLTSSDRLLVANNLLRPAANVLKQYVYDPKSNVRSWHSLAVGCIGFVLEDSTLTKHAVESTGGFKYQIANCIGADGIWWEATMQYHFFALSPLALLAEAAVHSGSDEDLYSYTSPNGRSLKMMFDAPIQLADAGFFLPGNNDSRGDRTLLDQELYELANKRYPDPQYDWVISKSPSPLSGYVLLEGYTLFGQPCALVAPPSPDRMIHAGVGWATLREDTTPQFWGSGSIMVMLDYGPHGGSHG